MTDPDPTPAGPRVRPAAEARVDDLLAAVVRWAEARPSLRGVALVGSHARGAARADSDVDLVLLATDPRAYLDETVWAQRFGEVVSTAEEDWGRLVSLRVVYADGPEVEFGLTDPGWAALPVDAGTRGVVADGMRILSDPDGLLARLRRAVAG